MAASSNAWMSFGDTCVRMEYWKLKTVVYGCSILVDLKAWTLSEIIMDGFFIQVVST